ncbi:MAG TPA: pitrilysin family protein, partial [Longimicrobiaceae bacterium]|nr:pitrilysin family protein [Longimicrobiaceae bacterium]
MRPAPLLLALAATLAAGSAAAQPRAAPPVPVEYHKLDNGLRVVLSRDTTAPTVVVGVYYDIGFRIEPRGRTGFAHLFEHMMFQGSQNLGKLEFIRLVESNGGVLNGSTRFDFTNYFEIVPAHTLEMMLWAEADRMRGLAVNQENLTNQQAVVKSEVRVNVLNQPYGGFPWLDLPQLANTNWNNAHNFYGDFGDLDAATLQDVQSFFHTYYAPNNAVLTIVGDFDAAQAMAWVRRYFAGIPAAPHPPRPRLEEPRQTAEKRVTRVDSLAQRPALAVGWHAPPQGTPEYFALGVLDQLLVQGRDSRLYGKLVQEKGYTADVSASVNLLGNMYDINGPALWTVWLFHDPQVPADSILAAMDQVVEQLRSTPVDQATLDLALVKVRSGLYDEMDGFFGFGRANLLASFALFRDDPGLINHLEEQFRAVTPALVQRTAQEYLRPTNRTILIIQPRPAAGGR